MHRVGRYILTHCGHLGIMGIYRGQVIGLVLR